MAETSLYSVCCGLVQRKKEKPTEAETRESKPLTTPPPEPHIPLELWYWEAQPSHISRCTFSFGDGALTFTWEDRVDGSIRAPHPDANFTPHTERRELTVERRECFTKMYVASLIQRTFFATECNHSSDR